MNRQTSINIPLTAEELNALLGIAKREFRHPRDQARYILRHALLNERDHATTKQIPTPEAECANA